jgi:dephospho-CoA kinase
MNQNALKIGLTGGIGCGKSTVADRFAALGAAVIDTDHIAHHLTMPYGAAMPDLLAEFGPACATADGALDRNWMRALVFSDATARARLEAVLHPRIRIATEAAAAAAEGSYLLFVVPLLLESGNWRERVDRVLVVDCPEELQIARVMARNGLPEQQVKAIMAAQTTRQARRAAADDIVVNEGEKDALAPQIDRLHNFYISLSEKLPATPSQGL